MKHQIIFRAAASATLTMGLLAGTNQVVADPLIDALSQGKVSANIRLRYEGVDDDTRSKDADAVTIRTRLGYQTADFNGWKLFGEIEDVTALDESYNSTVNGKGTYPVVADPEDTEINQLFVSYGGFADTWIKAGRQRIILDGARFVGNVGWRQNEQTYDAFSVVNKSLADTVFTYAYVSEVHRIFSDESPRGNSEMDSHLLNVSYSGFDLGKLTAYAYLLGFDDTTAGAIGPGAATKTIGVSFSGGTALSDTLKLLYAFEYADQSDYDDGASTNDADYNHLELGLKFPAVTVKVGREVLEGDGTYGFSTQLATLHKFNGWADKFLGTPAAGIEDTYVLATGKVGGVKLLAKYHWFESDAGSFDYGEELNLLAVKKFGKNYTVGLKYADYDADSNAANVGGTAADIEKLWFWGELKF